MSESTNLNMEVWSKMRQIGYRRKFGKGETILNQGEICNGLVCIQKGTVKTSIILHDGSEKIFGFFWGPALIGEAATLDTQPNICNVTAFTLVESFIIPSRKLKILMNEQPQVNQYIIESIARKLRSIALQLENQSRVTLMQRIAHFLENYNECIYPDVREKRDYLYLTHEMIASIVGAARPNVSICLHKMVEQNILEIHRGKLRILDFEKLRTYSKF